MKQMPFAVLYLMPGLKHPSRLVYSEDKVRLTTATGDEVVCYRAGYYTMVGQPIFRGSSLNSEEDARRSLNIILPDKFFSSFPLPV